MKRQVCEVAVAAGNVHWARRREREVEKKWQTGALAASPLPTHLSPFSRAIHSLHALPTLPSGNRCAHQHHWSCPSIIMTLSRHGLEICEREATTALMSVPTTTLVHPPPAPVVRTLSHSCFVAPSRKAKTSASPPHRHPWYPTAWRRSPALFPVELRASAPRQPLISHRLDRHCIFTI